MGELLNRKFKAGEPPAAVPAKFYNDVDEILTKLDVFGGHIERTFNNWTIVVDAVSGGALSRQFDITTGTGTGAVSIQPGMWVRDGHWNATRRASTYDYDPLSGAGVASNYTGTIYAYALLQYGSGYCANGWTPSSLASDNDGDPGTGNYTTWVPNAANQTEFAQGLDVVFIDAQINQAPATNKDDSIDPQGQWLLLGEITYDTGAVTGLTQVHRGPRIDTDPLWRVAQESSTEHLRPNIIYSYSTGYAFTVDFADGEWYSPRDGDVVSITGATIASSTIVGSITPPIAYATVLPREVDRATTAPDPAIAPSTAAVRFDRSIVGDYDGDAWQSVRKTNGQRLLAHLYAVEVFGTNQEPVLRAAFYNLGQGQIVNYYERPDSKPATGFTQIVNDLDVGKSIGYVASSVSANHEGETELYKFSDETYGEAASAFSDFSGDYAVLVRDKTGSGKDLKYVDISGITFPVTPGSIVPGDMDPGEDWGGWIDGYLHDHGAHEATSLTHAADHTWAWANGSQGDGTTNDFTRNYGQSIGDGTATKTVDLDNKQLINGDWAVTSATPAGIGTGAFSVSGGVYADDGIAARKNTGSWAAYFYDGTNSVEMATGTLALEATDGVFTAKLATGTEAVEATGNVTITGTSGDYYHNSNQGLSTQGHSGGIYTDADSLDAAIIDVGEMYL